MTISQQEVTQRLDNFRQTSRQKHLPLTPQKLEIFRILASSCTHPQAKDIYTQVKKTFPNISLATVYKNLIGFQELGLVTEIPLVGTPNRYDAKLDTHSHVVDTISGKVYDLGSKQINQKSQKIMGKAIKKTDIIYYL
jgi:Fur family peroxide stress response transcriptional regulator